MTLFRFRFKELCSRFKALTPAVKEAGPGLFPERLTGFPAKLEGSTYLALHLQRMGNLPIRRENRGGKTNILAIRNCIAGYRCAAGAIQCGQQRSFAGHGVEGRAVIDGEKQVVDPGIADPAFYADCPLRRRRGKGFHIEEFRDHGLLAQPLQSGNGQKRGIHLTFRQFAQAGFHRTTIGDDLKIGPKAADQRLPAQRCRAHHRPVRQIDELCSFASDKGIAHILPWQIGCDMQTVGQGGGHVLGGMNGKIQLAGGELLLKLQREQALAADVCQRPVGDAVARGGQHHDFEHLLRQAMCFHQPSAGFMGLRQRKRAASGADAERFRLHLKSSIVTDSGVSVF